MKLLTCVKCNAIFKLDYTYRECEGGHGGGQYVDNINAQIWGNREEIFVLGFANSSFVDALRAQIKHGDQEGMMPYTGGFVRKGRDFTAFIIPESAPSVKRVEAKFDQIEVDKNVDWY